MIPYGYPLVTGTLLRRYKRFLADVRLGDGQEVTAHCPNPGAMTGCLAPDAPCRLTHRPGPKRKLHWTLEQVFVHGQWIMVNTARPNAVVADGIARGQIAELTGYPVLERERPFGDHGGRVDILLRKGMEPDAARAYVEVKNLTLVEGDRGLFPDSVSKRATRHLQALMGVVRDGHRGVLLFHVGRGDAQSVGPADRIDPVYGQTLREAMAAGVELLAYRGQATAEGLSLGDSVPLRIPPQGGE